MDNRYAEWSNFTKLLQILTRFLKIIQIEAEEIQGDANTKKKMKVSIHFYINK